jgi:selenocysteine-specific elongation factor
MTKIDMVEPDLLELAEEDVRGYLADTPFADWPLVRVSGVTGEGRDQLVATLEQIAAEIPERSTDGKPRLAIDRSFVMEGFGTVVTGTLWAGSFSEGDQVEIQPAGLKSRIRQVQSHGHKVKTALAGSRTALALHGLAKAEVKRGHWVVKPGDYEPVSILDVRLHAVGSEDRAIRQRERLRFHLGAAEVFGRVTLFDGDELEPGDSALAQIRLEEPIVAARGDRFVVRWYSPIRTAGGGHLLEVGGRKRRRSDASAVDDLERLESGSDADRLLGAMGGKPSRGLTLDELSEVTGIVAAVTAAEIGTLSEANLVAELGRGRWVDAAWRREIDDLLLDLAHDYQRRFPLRYGIPLGELRSRLAKRLAADAVDAAVRALAERGEVFVRHDQLRAGSETVELGSGDRKAAAAFKQALTESGYAVPNLKTMEGVLRQASDAQELLAHLEEAGEIVRLTPELSYASEQLEQLERRVVERFRDHPTLAVAEFKEMAGVSRKHAVPLLEYLDKRGITRRAGDERVPGRRAADTP